jgi:hypothetical protein
MDYLGVREDGAVSSVSLSLGYSADSEGTYHRSIHLVPIGLAHRLPDYVSTGSAMLAVVP